MNYIKAKAPEFPKEEVEVTLLRWLKINGDQVIKDEAIAEIETSKVLFELPSPCFGVLKEQYVKPGMVIQAFQDMALIEIDEEKESEHRRIVKQLEDRRSRYCCSDMFDAVNNPSAPLRFEYAGFRNESYWEMKAEGGNVVGYPLHCPWCGRKLLKAFE